MRKAALMTVHEIKQELKALEDKWNDFHANLDEGYGGSPGEWMYERMSELETALKNKLK